VKKCDKAWSASFPASSFLFFLSRGSKPGFTELADAGMVSETNFKKG